LIEKKRGINITIIKEKLDWIIAADFLSFGSTNAGNILTFVVGLIGASLTLVGLLSIFISVTSQANVQKLREILWELKTETQDQKIIHLLKLYQDISRSDSGFSRSVINLSIGTIIVSMTAIVLTNIGLTGILEKDEAIFTRVFSGAILVLFAWFIRVLMKLKNIIKISKLPTFDELLDASTISYGVNTLNLAVHTMKVKHICYVNNDDGNEEIKREDHEDLEETLKKLAVSGVSIVLNGKEIYHDYPKDKYALLIGFPFPFKGLVLGKPERILLDNRTEVYKPDAFDLRIGYRGLPRIDSDDEEPHGHEEKTEQAVDFVIRDPVVLETKNSARVKGYRGKYGPDGYHWFLIEYDSTSSKLQSIAEGKGYNGLRKLDSKKGAS